MNIILVGFMGTGKSSVGRRLAGMLERPFVDMDEVIEKRAGKSISRIFSEEGESAFRAMERNLVRELAKRHGVVIAAGGGVILNPDNMADFARSGLVVCLSASREELIRRLKSSTDRPLLAEGKLEKKVSELLGGRQKLYDSIPCRIDTSGLSVDEVAGKIVEVFSGIACSDGTDQVSLPY